MRRMFAGLCLVEQGEGYVLHRRENDARRGAAGLIGIFGGSKHDDESYAECAARELGEETSLQVGPETLSYLGSVTVQSDRDHQPVEIHAEVYRVRIGSDMEVRTNPGEGDITRMTAGDALRQRDQLTPATRAVFERLL